MSKNAKQFGMAMIAVMALLAVQPNAGADPKESEKTKEAHRSGGGVGNGGEASRKAYIKKLKDELGELQLRKSTQTEEITGWSSKVANMLKTEMERAERRISKQNDLDAAKQIMQDALAVAGDSLELEPELAKPITKTLIDRGLMILIALDDTLDVSKKFDLKTEVNFLFDYMGFIIKKEKEHFLDQFCDSKDKRRSLAWVVLKWRHVPALCWYAICLILDFPKYLRSLKK
jgi:hypothetical protein